MLICLAAARRSRVTRWFNIGSGAKMSKHQGRRLQRPRYRGEHRPLLGMGEAPGGASAYTCLAPLERSSSGDFGYETGGALGAGGG